MTNFCTKHLNLEVQRVSKWMIRIQIIIPNKENALKLQNKLQTIKYILKFHSP